MKRTLLFSLVFFLMLSCKKEAPKNTILEGSVFGTYYRVTYNSGVNYQKQFDSLFYVINKSMSTYQVNSNISKINRNEEVEVDEHFKNVFNTSKKIYIETGGAFDPTIGAVVNAWDFGPEKNIVNLDSLKIDSLMQSVGLDKVKYIHNKIIKPQNTFIDFNAIAKGYAVDVIAKFLDNKKVQNYLINIGGELKLKGINIEKNKSWSVGVQDPKVVDESSLGRPIILKDKAMATSGTYRKFKVDETGNRYAHIIDTKTGYSSKTKILSVSVIAEDCMMADAYATAFQAMGTKKVITFLKSHPELKAFIIFENGNNELETLALNGFPEN